VLSDWHVRVQISLLAPDAGVAPLRYVSHLVPIVDSRCEVVEQDEVDGQVAHHVRPAVDRPIAEDIPGHAGTGSDVTVQLGGPRDVGGHAVLDDGSEGDWVAGVAVVVSELGLGAQGRLTVVQVVVVVGPFCLALFAGPRRGV